MQIYVDVQCEFLYGCIIRKSGTLCNGMTAIHRTDASGALDKLADYCKWASDYSREEILKMLSRVKTFVYIHDFQVAEVVENHGWDEDKKKIVWMWFMTRQKG